MPSPEPYVPRPEQQPERGIVMLREKHIDRRTERDLVQGTMTESIIVKGSAEDVYDAWSDLTMFQEVLPYVDRVEAQDDGTTRWTVEGPAGRDITWRAEFTRRQRPDRLAWSSKDDAGPVTTSGQATFHQLPDDQTEITVILKFSLGSDVAEFVAARFSNVEEEVVAALRAFKGHLEGRSHPERA